MDKQKVLSRLVWDLQSFLSLLDSENLSYIAQAQKKSLSELLSTLHSPESPVEDAEYMVMSCPSSTPTNEPTDSPASDGLWSELVSKMDLNLLQTKTRSSVPHLPPGGLGGADEEEEDTYEEAAPYVPESTSNNTDKAESDSSHYESYGDDDDDDDLEEGAGLVKDRRYLQWSASQPCLRPAPESRLCGYLWRRKWLGQWTKQLFIVKNNSLLCYKCARDLLPQMDLDLRGCVLVYKSKPNRKIPHQLKVVPVGSESLVLGYSSFQHADEWKKVMEELSCGQLETHSSSVIRAEPPSCRSSVVQTDSDEDKSSHPHSLQDKGFLNVLMNCQWQSLQCEVENGVLNMFAHREQDRDQDQSRSPQYTVSLTGCEVRPGPDTDHSFRITLSTLTDQLAVLEVSSSEEKEHWLQLLKDKSPPENTSTLLRGLQTRRFPTSNPYMDDPFHLSLSQQKQPIYSNSSVLEHRLNSSKASTQDSVTYSNTFTNSNNKKLGEERCIQRLELAGKTGVQLRAGSEVNLSSAAKQNKRSSFRQSLAVCTERAQASFLNPLLRRTASAKVSLKRAPSALFIESGKVFQRKKEWETKATA